MSDITDSASFSPHTKVGPCMASNMGTLEQVPHWEWSWHQQSDNHHCFLVLARYSRGPVGCGPGAGGLVLEVEEEFASWFVQRLRRPGRQLWHWMPAFTHEQFTHRPVLLHLQQFLTISIIFPPSAVRKTGIAWWMSWWWERNHIHAAIQSWKVYAHNFDYN